MLLLLVGLVCILLICFSAVIGGLLFTCDRCTNQLSKEADIKSEISSAAAIIFTSNDTKKNSN